jgi:hypothetical protein
MEAFGELTSGEGLDDHPSQKTLIEAGVGTRLLE